MGRTGTGIATSLQAEWQYLCRCVPGVGRHLAPVEDAIKTLLIPALLELPLDHVQAELRTLLSHGVKAGGMNLRNPEEGADRLFEASKEASGILVASLRDRTPLDSVAHGTQVRGARAAACKDKAAMEKAAVKEMKDKAARNNKKLKRLKLLIVP